MIINKTGRNYLRDINTTELALTVSRELRGRDNLNHPELSLVFSQYRYRQSYR